MHNCAFDSKVEVIGMFAESKTMDPKSKKKAGERRRLEKNSKGKNLRGEKRKGIKIDNREEMDRVEGRDNKQDAFQPIPWY